MPSQLPKIIGNRGAAAYAPENTIEGIHTAADMGVEWVQFDVKLTKDGIPILFHDDTLDRTTNGAGPVAQTDFAQIRELEAGSWFSDSFAGILVPTLEEAIEALIMRGLGANMEIRPCPGRERETAEVALDILAQYWDDHERLLISSFQHVSLETTAEMASDWARGLLLEAEWPPNWRELADYLDVTTINIDGNVANRAQIEEVADAGYSVCAYTINDPQRACHLLAWGVDSLVTDVPDVIGENLPGVH
ncbi:MAG: glycerophosphoryl diester phosphodiesterase [Alphaproteobacteria bacterium]|nr:glycerophosphoryl diester phosphodiesterase [Alphaproteobacteria bacterium]